MACVLLIDSGSVLHSLEQDTLELLRLFADSLPPSMTLCRVILGDFNCKIGRKETGQICGSCSMHAESCIGGLQEGDLMREQDRDPVATTSTMFRPRKSLALGSATYNNNRKVQKATQKATHCEICGYDRANDFGRNEGLPAQQLCRCQGVAPLCHLLRCCLVQN